MSWDSRVHRACIGLKVANKCTCKLFHTNSGSWTSRLCRVWFNSLRFCFFNKIISIGRVWFQRLLGSLEKLITQDKHCVCNYLTFGLMAYLQQYYHRFKEKSLLRNLVVLKSNAPWCWQERSNIAIPWAGTCGLRKLDKFLDQDTNGWYNHVK